MASTSSNKSSSAFFVVLTITILSVLIFSPGLNNFFFADDWFHLKITKNVSVNEFINFFSFTRSSQFAGSYRPLSTQTFFLVFQNFFGLNPIPYHIFVFLIFCLNLVLLHKLTLEVFKNQKLSLLSIFIFGISATNFTRLYFLSAAQEIFMTTFVLAGVLTHLRSRMKLTMLFFILSLLCKETAIVFPGILFLIDWYRKRVRISSLILLTLILVFYGFMRLVILGNIEGESYVWDFSTKRVTNTTFWYVIWSFGTPEFLLDYISSGLKVIPRFYTDFKGWALPMLSLIIVSISAFFILVALEAKENWRKISVGTGIFLGGLIPVIFLPFHKFTIELGIPMIGFSLIISSMLKRKSLIGYFFGTLFVITNISSNYLLHKYHYSVNQSVLSKKVFQYFLINYNSPPRNSYFEFINDTKDYGSQWGSSKQISQATSGSNMFKVLYNDSSYEVHFADFNNRKPENTVIIPLSTKMFTQ